MRIALAVSEFPSASQTFVLDHAAGLMERGHRVQLHAEARGRGRETHEAVERFQLLSHTRYQPPASKQTSGLMPLLALLAGAFRETACEPRTVLRVVRGGGNRAERLRRCLTFLGPARSIDLVHAHSGYNGRRLLPLYFAGHLRAPLVVTFHGHDAHAYLKSKPGDWYAPLFKQAAALVVCSEWMRQRLCALGAPADKLHLIPNGIALQRLPYVLREPRKAAPLRLLGVGRLVPFKGFSTLLAALGGPLLHGLDWQLDLIGDGPERGALLAQAANLGIANRVVFHGSTSREVVSTYLQASDFFVAPVIVDEQGNTETQGVAVLEAMASGIPVIATDAGALPETLGGTAAALTAAGSPQHLAESILRCLRDPAATHQQAEAARRRVEQHYAASRWLDRLEQLYASLVNTAPTP